MKNILLIIPNMDFGGAQRSFSKLSLALSKKYTVVNVVFNKEDGIAYPLGGELVSLDIKGSSSFLSKGINFYKRVSKLKKIKKEHQIDVAISFLEGADFINILSNRQEKIILSLRGSKQSDETIHGLLGWIRKAILIPFLYKKADWIMTVNHGIVYELNQFFNLSKAKKKVIYNYYDVEAILRQSKEPLPDEYKDLNTKPYVVFSGRLAPEKGIEKLLSVYALLKNRTFYRFVIVGSGPIKESLHLLCKQLGLHATDRYEEHADVIFVGAQDNPHKFVARSQVFLMGSSSEGFPNGLAEAMACKVPVMSTDCPWGPREILSEHTVLDLPEYANYGILLPMLNTKGKQLSNSLSTWSTVLDNLLQNEELRKQYREKGYQRIKQFDETLHFNLWEELINE